MEQTIVDQPVEIVEPIKEEIVVVDVENPAWASSSVQFADMIRKFVDNDLKKIPSIKYETLLNYLTTTVDGIYRQKISGVNPNLIQVKVQVGMIGDNLIGFQMYHMLTNRMPHIQTMNILYIYSENPALTYKFAMEVQKYKKLWNARFLMTTVTNEKLNKVVKRFFKKGAVVSGTYYTATGIRSGMIKC